MNQVKSVIFSCILGMLMVSTAVHAQTATAPSTGNGTTASPYQIATLDNLYWISQDTVRWSKTYLLTTDIDASPTLSWNSGAGFTKIGDETNMFTGTFHGHGHVIKNLFMKATTNMTGLFGYANGVIDSLGILNCKISGTLMVGAVAGANAGTIKSCYSTGIISGSSYLGGITGANEDAAGNISNCYSSCSIIGTANMEGGLVGWNYGGTITYSYFTGNVLGNVYTGGVAGVNTGTIAYCYAAGKITGTGDSVGGIVGISTGTITNCFWDKNTTGKTSAGNGSGILSATGLTTATMKKAASFSGWNFTTNFILRTDSTYPGLRTLDNAPFAFADTLTTSRHFSLSQLLTNDCDIESKKASLIVKVSVISKGVTDSISTLTFTPDCVNGTVDTIKYRIGEVRATDTLWGNIATSLITLDTTMTTAIRTDFKSQSVDFSIAIQSGCIGYSLPATEQVSLQLYSMNGQMISTLINKQQNAGHYSVNLQNGLRASGSYLVVFKGGKFVQKKMVYLMK